MYNAYQQPSPYGQPPPFANFPGALGMPPAPGMAAPGTGAAPGMQQHEAYPPQAGGFPANFQPPANINFSAPVIRLGTAQPPKSDMLGGGRDDRERGGGGAGRRAGLGMGHHQDGGGRPERGERIQQIVPATKEEIIRTIFVGGITEGCGGDEGVERILRAAGNLRRWIRATDSDDKPCRFGFAEFEDPESLATAIEVLRDVEVPVKRQVPGQVKSEVKSEVKDEVKKEDGEDEGDEEEKIIPRKSRLLFVADEKSKAYIESWAESKGDRYEDEADMRIDQARDALQAVLSDLANPSVPKAQDDGSKTDRDGDFHMADGVRIDGSSADIVNIPISADDELSDIPAEMRETVAKEITAFRDRSNRRDLERLRREEEMELQERNRMMNGNSYRQSSPPVSAPSGPAGGANGIPVGPRDRVQPPAGPKGFGAQIPRDYQKGVSFINGTGIDAKSAFENEDTDASDEELERRRKAKKDAELEKSYLDQERRWLNRERSRTAALERETVRDKEDEEHLQEEREAMAKRLREWNDDEELARKEEEYYADRSMWIRNRTLFRSREIAEDDTDRLQQQQHETTRTNGQREQAGRQADDFLHRHTEEMQLDQPPLREPARFKLSLGAAAQKVQANTAQQKRTVAEVEGLLDEEEEEDTTRRELVPIKFDPAAAAADLTDEERAQALKQLAQDIPTSKDGLWAWEVKWEFLDEATITEKLKPFVEKKIVEYLGVQEQMLVDLVEGHLRKHAGPRELVEQLEGALDEEAEVLVKKLWRMVIFFSESEKKGLAA